MHVETVRDAPAPSAGGDWKLDGMEPARDPLQDAARRRLSERYFVKGYVILGREPGRNAYTGYVEHSFSMGPHEERARLWRKRSDRFEGLRAAEHNRDLALGARGKDWPEPWAVWDVDDPECPVEIDWVWHEAHLERPGSMYGVDKFEARNPKFVMRDPDAVRTAGREGVS